ncbi:hypothetical protein G9A89_014837 [Geosiphon pyriformis]|nr:hypothetical protein G9A89_014837 [Geosiphon pyriformis]
MEYSSGSNNINTSSDNNSSTTSTPSPRPSSHHLHTHTHHHHHHHVHHGTHFHYHHHHHQHATVPNRPPEWNLINILLFLIVVLQALLIRKLFFDPPTHTETATKNQLTITNTNTEDTLSSALGSFDTPKPTFSTKTFKSSSSTTITTVALSTRVGTHDLIVYQQKLKQCIV